ncbi:MAG: helix-turn-helix domain-containing protein [Thermoanaerobaculia bacterium]|nr:helix-turn-helix domain-containing protein [Thermoanaerobaculia bacterium]
MATATTDPVHIVPRSSQAAALLHPLRRRLLDAFRTPASAAEVARRLSQPRQRVGHHVRELQSHGLLVSAGERRTGNFVEKLLRSSAMSYVISPEALGELAPDPKAIEDRVSSAYLLATAARTLGDVADLRRRAAGSGKRLATLTLESEVRFASPQAQAGYAQELASTLRRLAAKYHDEAAEGGRTFRFTVAGHPAIERPATPSGDDDDEN